MKKEIGKKIREVREKQNLTLYMVGEKIGSHQNIVRNIEAGETAYSIDSLIKTCDVLGLKLEVVAKLLPNEQITEDSKACALALHP